MNNFVFLPLVAFILGALLTDARAATEPRSGATVWDVACAACHGFTGAGTPQSTHGMVLQPADLSACETFNREPDLDWAAVTALGGPARGFSALMPAFGEALRAEEIDAVIAHARGFCKDPDYPRGDLNLPRAMFTEKAFVEDELVITSAVALDDVGAVASKLIWEKRLGKRTQIEVILPYQVLEAENGSWSAGLGDVAFGAKTMLLASLDSGTALSLAGEAILPSGQAGFTSDDLAFEPFISVGQVLPRDGFFHGQVGSEIKTGLLTDTTVAAEGFARAALGMTFAQGPHGFGRAWSPMVELLAVRELRTGAAAELDLAPGFQVTLNQRQHVMAALGCRFPIDGEDRPWQAAMYLLWDTFDGALVEGW